MSRFAFKCPKCGAIDYSLNGKIKQDKLAQAKTHIHRLLVLLTEGKRSYAVIDEARAFMKELEDET